jgi:hypothetical protein
LTLQTSCFKLVLGVQHAPLGTGRLAFCAAGIAKAKDARERAMARVNFMVADLVGWVELQERNWGIIE